MPTAPDSWFRRNSAAVSALAVIGAALAIGAVDRQAPATARSEPRHVSAELPTQSGYTLVEQSRFAAGGTRALATYGDYVVLAVDAEFRVVDVSDPRKPAIVGRLELGGIAEDIVVDGQLAYVSASPLVIVDLERV